MAFQQCDCAHCVVSTSRCSSKVLWQWSCVAFMLELAIVLEGFLCLWSKGAICDCVWSTYATCNLVLTCVFCCVAISALYACACVANMHVFLCVQQSSSAACHLLQQKSTSADLLLPLHCTPLAPSLEQRNLSPMPSTSKFTYRSKNYPWPREKNSIEGGNPIPIIFV